uniref:Uncharacterized protein n=1 Tax=Anguilla anguilla TaxID=7936 RepID=A0A0E9VNG7_ANGAN
MDTMDPFELDKIVSSTHG